MSSRNEESHLKMNSVVQDLKTFLVCGMTGVGKSTFINKVTGAQLSVSGGIESETVEVFEEGIPLFKVGNEYIQLVDTPGFGDSRETSETAILKRITTWLVARYMSKVPVTGVIFLRPIYDVRGNQLEKALMTMFKDLCGNDCLDHIFLVTTRWTPEVTVDGGTRESELVTRTEFLGSEGKKRVQVRRLNENYSAEEAQLLVKSCAGLPSVTFQIQREVVDQDKTLGQTRAGMRIGADLEEKLSGLQDKAKKASEYAVTAKKQLEEAEQAKLRLEEERSREAEKARKETEAAEEARRAAEAAKDQSQKGREEAEERAKKAEEASNAARQAAEATRQEKEEKLEAQLNELRETLQQGAQREQDAQNEMKSLQNQIGELKKPVEREPLEAFLDGLVRVVTFGQMGLPEHH